MPRRSLLVLLTALLAPGASLPAAEGAPEVLEAVLAGARHPWLRWPDISDHIEAVRALYAGEPDGLLWFEGERLHPAAGAAVEALVEADARGLSALDYDAPLLLVRLAEVDGPATPADARALFDLALSVGLVRHFSDLHRGRVDPRRVGFAYDHHGDDLDLPALVRTARDQGRFEPTLDGLEPRYPIYARLKAALPGLLALARGPSLPHAPEVKKLSPGDEYDGLEALAARLRAFGDLDPGAPLPLRYEGVLVDAVRRLQERFGLEADGVLGRDTFRAAHREPAQLAEQVTLALERLRWLPDLGRGSFVVVNVPAYRLWAFESADRPPVLTMKIVVGRALRSDTPIFYGEMRYLTLRPYWNVPYGIATRELLPKALQDGGALEREEMELVPVGNPEGGANPPTPENLDRVKRGILRIRQKPGPKNALGRVVFSFPNDDNIYMHDTPARQLFARARRDFSHGCIRLEDPLGLLRWVLRDQPEWTASRFEAAFAGDRPVWVGLRAPLPVVVFYSTAFVDGGVTRFTDDIYGLDARLREALAHGYPYPRAVTR